MKLMKSMLAIVCSAALLFALTAAQAEDAYPLLARFSMGDMAVSYVYVNASPEEARAVFGNPANVETVTLEATGEDEDIWQYDGLTLTFSETSKLIGAEVSDAAYAGPRGIKIGDTRQDVIGRFYTEPDIDSDEVLYSAGYIEAFDAQLPPCGLVLDNGDGTASVCYAAPAAPFSADILADPTDYVYEVLALFTVTLDSDGLVTGYGWSLGPWAE